jgi:hypothetical protein
MKDTDSQFIRIFVGLGGFGTRVIQRLYKLIKDKNKEEIPPYFKFASYDSASHERQSLEDFPFSVDFMRASPDGPQEFLNNCRNNFPSFSKWWPGIWEEKDEKHLYDLKDLIFSGKGLGQYRPYGRLGFFKHLNDVPNNIISLINEQLDNASKSINVDINALTPRVIIVNSLAGGTGSSSFLDVAALVKHEIQKLNNAVEIILFTVTGEASMKGRASEQADSYQWALANSYAALSELDYFQNDLTNASFIEIEYPFSDLKKLEPPIFKHASIICQDNGLNKSLPKWSDYIGYLAETLYVIEGRSTTSGKFTSVFDNILGHLKRYGSIGVGSIHYRYKDGLLFQFSQFAEEIVACIINPDTENVRISIEKEIETLHID